MDGELFELGEKIGRVESVKSKSCRMQAFDINNFQVCVVGNRGLDQILWHLFAAKFTHLVLRANVFFDPRNNFHPCQTFVCVCLAGP